MAARLIGRRGPMILIALGANLPSRVGPPADTLKRALGELERQGVKIRQISAFYKTPAWPDPAEPFFVNAVAAIETTLQPVELLMLLHGVETDLGRLRSAANAPRTVDLDLLDYDGRIIATSELTLPHPRMRERSFVLVPLRDVVPDWRYPATGERLSELLAALPDREVPERLSL
jgi:2-amino-4-hydroxy-6-hydroxymethyldihydropteridine diphosphokinase